MTLKSIIFAACREFKSEAGTDATWFQTTPPYGDYPGGNVAGPDGKVIEGAVVRFDATSVKRVVDSFNAQMAAGNFPGILVDREHFSLNVEKPSDAMAWATAVRVADDGSIWTKWDFTPEGKRLFDEKILVSRSPVLTLKPVKGEKKVFTPTALESIGMTNTPHFKNLSTLAAARQTQTTKGNEMDPKILEALGLAEGATLEDVLAAIKALKDEKAAAVTQATDAEKKANDAETACRGLKADAFIAANKERISDVAKFREAYLKAPEATEAAFGLFKAQPAATAPATRIAAKDAKTPTATAGATAKVAARNSAVNAYMSAHRCSFQAAWDACRAADPESFAD